MPISTPIIAEAQKSVHFNVLFAHLFCHLSKSQAMSVYGISPYKLLAVTALLDKSVPAIKGINNMPTSLVTARTVAYIHTLIIDTVSVNHSDSPNARALRTESMARKT